MCANDKLQKLERFKIKGSRLQFWTFVEQRSSTSCIEGTCEALRFFYEDGMAKLTITKGGVPATYTIDNDPTWKIYRSRRVAK